MNNTYALKAVEDAMNEIIVTSFDYLYELQNHNIGYKRFDFKMSDLLRSNTINNVLTYYPRKYTCFVSENFISENRRLAFKRSKFYNKEISFYDTIENPEVFSFSFVMFVDGLFFLDGINILCKEDITYFIFNIKETPEQIGIPKDKFDELMAKDADITIFYIPAGTTGTVTTNKHVIKKYQEDGLPMAKFNMNGSLIENETNLTLISPSDKSGGLRIGTGIEKKKMMFDDVTSVLNLPNPNIDIHLFNFKHVLEIKKVRGESNFFQIDQQETPVPIENVMIFGTHGEYKHNISLKLYYPNVYEVVGREGTEPLDIYFFYYDDTVSTLHEYKNELAVYYKYTKNVLEKYENNTILDIIKNYKSEEISYSIDHFEHSRQFLHDHFKYKNETLRSLINKDANNFKYKNETLRSLINKDANMFLPYLRRQVQKSNGYYIDISKLDLTSRLRYNNKDVGMAALFEIFDEPRYLFVFRNEFKDSYMNATWFIDGEMYRPDKYYRSELYEFYYIPTAIVRHSSIIEIEKMKEFNREFRCSFSHVNQKLEFELNKQTNVDVFYNDIFMTIEDGTILDKNDYSVIVEVEGEEFIIKEDSFLPIENKFKVQLNNHELTNVALRVNIKKNCKKKFFNIDSGYMPTSKLLNDTQGNKYELSVTDDRKIVINSVNTDKPGEDYIHLISENDLDWACYVDDDAELKIVRLKPDILLSSNGKTYKLGVSEEKMLYIEEIDSRFHTNIEILNIDEILYNLGIEDELLYIEEILENPEIVKTFIGKHVISDDNIDYKLTVEDGLLCMEEIPPQFKVEMPIKSEILLTSNLRRFNMYATSLGKIDLQKMSTVEGADTLLGGRIEFTMDMNKDKRHLRVYRNGKLISPSFYTVRWGKKLQDINKLYLHQMKEVGDVYAIECLPYKSKEVAFIREVPENGFVDLDGMIDKPIDLKWYDIFVNGNKLNRDQIEIISPTKMFLKNVNSNMNLSVLEVDRDKEYFGFENSSTIIDKIWDIDEDFRQDVDDAIPDIDITEDDIINEELAKETIHIQEFWENFLKFFGFINPDENQIPEGVREEYNALFNENVCLLDPDLGGDNDEALTIYGINPDSKE